MTVKPGSVLPSFEVLLKCRSGLTKHIRKAKATVIATQDTGLRKHYKEKLHKLKIIREEIQYLIDVL